MLAGAGNETTGRLIGWLGKVLGDHPDQRRQIAADSSLIPTTVEETLRYEPTGPHRRVRARPERQPQGRAARHEARHQRHAPDRRRFHRQLVVDRRLGASPGTGAYSAAKAGVISFTKSAAVEYGSEGIRANAVCPGFVETELTGGPGSGARFPQLIEASA